MWPFLSRRNAGASPLVLPSMPGIGNPSLTANANGMTTANSRCSNREKRPSALDRRTAGQERSLDAVIGCNASDGAGVPNRGSPYPWGLSVCLGTFERDVEVV